MRVALRFLTGWGIAGTVLLGATLPSAAYGKALSVAIEEKLVPLDAQADGEVGWSVNLDAGTLAVGADEDSRAAAGGGAVFVYVPGAGVPTLQAALTASDAAAGDSLGISVDVDGDALLAGAYHRFAPTVAPGKAYVFRRTGSTWSEEAKLVAPDAQNNNAFGWAVTVKGDIAIVGAPNAWVGSPSGNGGAYVFERIAGVWTFDTKLTRAGEHSFGWSLDFDGTTLVVGAQLTTGPNVAGRVFVYERDLSGTWTFKQQLAPADLGSSAEFGNAVALGGNTLLVGAWFNTAGGAAGSAYFFERSGDTWTQSAKFDSPGGAHAENFGEAVAIDGDRAIVTDSGLDTGVNADGGAAYVFERGTTGWKMKGAVMASDGSSSDYFGTSVAIRGRRIAVGAAYAYDLVSDAATGAAYLLQLAAGSKLAIKNALPDNESKNTIVAKLKGLSVDLPLPGSPGDPTCAGGLPSRLEIASSTSGAFLGQDLPCANWQQTPSGYRYRDPELDDGPCKEVYFRPDDVSTIRCSGAGPSVLAFDLEPGVVQAPISVRLTLGSQSFCTTFGGTFKSDGTDGRKLNAVNAGAPEVCTGP
ncbi:MAG: hypothetical protein U0527_16105 [Candidatus Eisenbacteria bacterium]